jgi:hypothetical protein
MKQAIRKMLSQMSLGIALILGLIVLAEVRVSHE